MTKKELDKRREKYINACMGTRFTIVEFMAWLIVIFVLLSSLGPQLWKIFSFCNYCSFGSP